MPASTSYTCGYSPGGPCGPSKYTEIEPRKPYLLFVLRDVRANLSCALSSYQIEPTARDSPQNYIGIDALQTLSVVHFVRV